MKTLAIIAIAVSILSVATQVHAGGRGYSSYGLSRSGYSSFGSSRSSGYVYRNPYATYPSVSVRGYTKSTGTFVTPHYRTPGNYTITDNLSYRGYGTIRLPR